MEDKKRRKQKRVTVHKTKGSLYKETIKVSVADNQKCNLLNLPQQIITFEILIRLPVKCLVRFKTVCKEWNSVISSPEFAKLQLEFSKKSPSYGIIQNPFIIHSGGSSEILNCRTIIDGEDDDGQDEAWDRIPFYDYCKNLSGSVTAVGSCNGLLCLHIERWFFNNEPIDMLDPYPETPSLFCIWNPCIDEFRQLLAPRYCTFGGFGYVSSVDDYKIFALGPFSAMKAFLYSSRDRVWYEFQIPKIFNDVIFYSDVHGAFVDEILHWGYSDNVIAFKLEDADLDLVPTDEWKSAKFSCQGTCVLGGSLGAWGSSSYTDGDPSYLKTLEFWTYKRNGSSAFWEKLFKVDGISMYLDENLYGCFGFTKSGKIFVHGDKYELKLVDIHGNPPNFVTLYKNRVSSITGFTESLISPDLCLGKTRGNEISAGVTGTDCQQ